MLIFLFNPSSVTLALFINLYSCRSSDWVLHCQPATLTVIDQVSCGNEHVLALSRDKRIFTLGNSSRGQLGLGSTRSRDTFTLVDSLEPLRFLMVVAGGWHCLALSGMQYSLKIINH